MSVAPQGEPLTGWGRATTSWATVLAATDLEALRTAVASSGHRGVLARGLGRSYGDAALNGGGRVLTLTGLDAIGPIDTERGVVRVEGGASLATVLTRIAPEGWFLPVLPGTGQVTIGGAVAADVHGKNHHHVGALGRHLRTIELLDAAGDLRRLEPSAAEFRATVGGMGLTGIVVAAELELRRVPPGRLRVRTQKASGWDEALAALDTASRESTYAVAWVDTLTRGARFGRSVITAGDHVEESGPSAPPTRVRRAPEVPRHVPGGLLNLTTARAWNELWFRRASDGVADVPWPTFFHPLDGIRGWNRLYGPRGFVQYQCVVPTHAPDVLRAVLEQLDRARVPSFLSVLKLMGPVDDAYLSFPMPGWTLALDIPATVPGLAAVLDACDRLVAAAGGRVYLAKDARLAAELMPVMYPQLATWQEIRNQMDPEHRFGSDLSRRLRLAPARDRAVLV